MATMTGMSNERRVIGYDVGVGGDGGPVYARADGAGEPSGLPAGDDVAPCPTCAGRPVVPLQREGVGIAHCGGCGRRLEEPLPVVDESDFEPQHYGVDGRGDERMPPATPESEGTGASDNASSPDCPRAPPCVTIGFHASDECTPEPREPNLHDQIRAASFVRSEDCACGANVARWVDRESRRAACNGCGAEHFEPRRVDAVGLVREPFVPDARAAAETVAEMARVSEARDADELERLLPGLAATIASIRGAFARASVPGSLARAAELLDLERERLTKRVAELEARNRWLTEEHDAAQVTHATNRARVAELEAAGRVACALAKDFAAQAAAEQSIRNWLRAHGHDLSRPWDEVVIALLEAPPVGSVAEAMAQIDNAIANTKNATPDDLYTIGSHDAYVTAARILRSAIAPSPIGTRDLYVPSEEHRTTEPLCAALARGGATKDEAIEWLTRAMLDWKKQAAHLALLQPPAPIIIERDAPSPVTPPLSLAPRWLALPPAARSRVAARLHDALRDVRHEMDAEDIEANEALIELASAEPSGMDAIVAEVVARVEAVGVAASTRPAIAVADAWQWIGREAKEKRGREGFLTIATMAIHGMIDGDAAKGGST